MDLIICQDNFVVVFLYLKCFYTMSLSNSLKYTCRELQSQLKLIVLFLLLCSGGSLDLVKTFDDIEKFRVATGASSVMLARAAMWNPSIFRQQGALSVETVMDKYIQYVSGTQFTKIPTVTNSEQQKMSCHYFFCHFMEDMNLFLWVYRPFAMTITHLTPNTAYARCLETELSLRLENSYMQLRQLPKSGN